MKKKIAILGSSGSVGTQALEVLNEFKDSFEVYALAVHSNIQKLEEQILKFSPKIVAVFDEEKGKILKGKLKNFPCRIVFGMEGLLEMVSASEVDFVLSAMSGNQGLIPTMRAVEEGKQIGLANKEVLVCAGELFMKKVKEKGVSLLPIDSEHSAIFQCLKNEPRESVKRIILTASGGPFLRKNLTELRNVTQEMALQHPTYRMGKKISVDSSTLMNKGLEVIEAHFLFDVPEKNISIVIHPESIIHSMVEFQDGSILSQMSPPDMRIPIQYALCYPDRKKNFFPHLDFSQCKVFHFELPDFQKFPCLNIALEALRKGKSFPCFMNGCNDVLVERFLQGEIFWHEIFEKLEKLMSSHLPENLVNLEEVFEVDRIARRKAREI